METNTTTTPTAHDTLLIELLGIHASTVAAWQRAERKLASSLEYGFDGTTQTQLEAAIADADADALTAWQAVQDHEASFTGWERYYLVTSSQGHVHTTMACSTCHARTTFALLPQLSGTSAEQAVADQGEILCSVCFPEAPVAWTNGTSKVVQAERDAKAAAKAERAAKKAAKALGPIATSADRVETIHQAKAHLTSAAEWGTTHPMYPAHEVQLVAEALAAKLGTSVEAEMAAAQKRADRRR